ncbi:hypothetical protein FC093_00430 [Ilyomonas limi]|uniref:Uncharacterized protein n=1 Tax=Ilyomonas limi TaxID=2575867 RepID=A0A4U3LCD8_9BACT|nr:hypothetical protein [Ilyomonas limi]TKK71527.1 hypothetical protein FC093_00430 [Ilyomonas limi]
MQPLEHIDAQIKEAILVNGGDIDIADYPYIIKEAEAQGISRPELARRIRKVYESIDWRPYNKIDKLLEPIILKGSITGKEADAIVTASEQDLQRPKVENYILQNIKKRGFLPREKNAFEYDSFKNRWMTEEAWQRYQREKTAVEWLGEMAHSLEEMGDISLRKPEDARYFLRNTNYLVPSITMLTKSPSKADEFSKIIENEPNLDKRYLKVLYRLNRELPFRLNSQDFATINTLFDKTATGYALFVAASEQYSKGHIHIWLNETDAINADKLTGGFDYNSFLKFLYKINNTHPFYIGSLRFDSPEQLVQQAQTDASLWSKIAEAIMGGQIQAWLIGSGREEWVYAYNKQSAIINGYTIYTDAEKQLAAVQALIQIIDKNAPGPILVSDQQKVTLLSVEGSRTVHYTVHLRLVSAGFTKADIYIDNPIDGISLNNRYFTFWSQNGETDCLLTVTIAALQLIKNKTYTTNIHVDTAFQNLVIPLQVKVVFPLKAYLIQVLKYALFGALFFVLIRYITGILANQPSWFNAGVAAGSYSYLPQHYVAYFAGLVLLAGGLIGAIFLIRKWEKI